MNELKDMEMSFSEVNLTN